LWHIRKQLFARKYGLLGLKSGAESLSLVQHYRALHQAHCLGNLSLSGKNNVDTTARNRNSCPYKERYKIVSTMP
jgi:hypothetical protein